MRHRDPADVIDHFVALVLGHIDREYPHKLDHVMNDASEVKGPRALHPIFYGSFDWHSSVHGHWLLVRALLRFPKLAQQGEVIRVLDARFTPENVKVETEYLGQKLRATFERTYGWAWFLKLAAEIVQPPGGRGLGDHVGEMKLPVVQACSRWDEVLQPLTVAFVDRYIKYLPKATYPIRVGVHQNAAFGLALAWDYARLAGHWQLSELIEGKARAWYFKDQNYHGWEPDGTDFLSPGLMEAELMRRVLAPDDFLAWFGKFLPRLAEKQPAAMFEPAFVSDRTDGQITHLDGLNLSRAWCFRSLGRALPEGDPRRAVCEEAYTKHLEAALPHVSGDYMGEHWLATFALLAMTE
ncbi:MAG TPA: DUF2891 domain-containing protein [Phycisphaerales bacterium]|nr:DUF2891 domain-containing protein [Phycisphaerales bacterium]